MRSVGARHIARQCNRESDIDAVVGLFERIAAEEGWQPGGELRAHGDRSAYFALWLVGAGEPPHRRVPVGGLQLVRPDDQGMLPSHAVWPELPLANQANVGHVAVLAVVSSWRGKAAEGGIPVGNGDLTGGESFASCFWILVAALWRHCVESGVRELWLESTPVMLRCYRLLGWPLQVRGPLREHWGEPCYPCSLSVREVAGALAERAVRLRSKTYRRILADALLPVSDDC